MTPAEIESYVDAVAAALELPIAAEHRAGTLQYLGIAFSMAEMVALFPLTLTDEPAGAFVPISPSDVPAS